MQNVARTPQFAIQQAVQMIYLRAETLCDPMAFALEIEEGLEELRRTRSLLVQLRSESLRAAVDSGIRPSELAAVFRVSRQRINQMLNEGIRRPQRHLAR